MKTVLYITERLAVWIGFNRKTLTNVHAETLCFDQDFYKPCPWLGDKPRLVHLVLDSEAAEIQQVPLQPTKSVFQNRSNSTALRKRLNEQFPDGVTRSPTKGSGIDALLVEHINIRDTTRQWLAHVEGSNLTFCSVTTVSELLASLCSDGLTKTAQGEHTSHVVLSEVLGTTKHTLCISGHAVFTRTVSTTDSAGLAAGLDDTLRHLRSTELPCRLDRFLTLGFSTSRIAGVAELNEVSTAQRIEDVLPELPVLDKKAEKHHQYATVIVLARQALKYHKPRFWREAFPVSLVNAKFAKASRMTRSRVRFAGVMAIALMSVGFTVSVELQRREETAHIVEVRQNLLNDIERTKQDVLNISPAGLPLSTALQQVVLLRSVHGVSPAILLTVLAEAFTEHRELVLQELRWISIDPAHAQQLNAYSQLKSNQTSFRQRVPTTGTLPSDVMVNVSGSTSAGVTLREQQASVSAIVALLEGQDSISDLELLASPLMQAAKQDGDDQGTVSSASVFRIQFRMTRIDQNEA